MAMKQALPMQNRQAPATQAFQRAVALHQQGKLEQAERLYRAALAAQPSHFEALYWCGMLFYQQGRNSEALGFVGAAMKARPADATALASLGLIHATMGDLEQAVANYDRALALKPIMWRR
jgi:tetratricopeptide (TPR) repeat protein